MNKSNRCGFGGSERGEGSNFTAKCKIDSKNVSGRKWEKKNSPENHPENWDQNVQITKEIKKIKTMTLWKTTTNFKSLAFATKQTMQFEFNACFPTEDPQHKNTKYNSNCGAEVHVPKKMVPEGKEKSCAVYP